MLWLFLHKKERQMDMYTHTGNKGEMTEGRKEETQGESGDHWRYNTFWGMYQQGPHCSCDRRQQTENTRNSVYGKAFSLDGLLQESGVTKKNDSNNKDVSYEISIKQGKINIIWDESL